MSRLRTILMNMNVINGLLMAAIASVVYFGVAPVLNPTIAISLPRGKPVEALAEKTAAVLQNVSPADYAVIGEQNLFHPERRIPPGKQDEKAIPKPELFLYGTLITDKGSFAFIENRKAPYSTSGRGKRQTTIKKGDNIQGYTLSEVQADRIVLAKGEDTLVVMLRDGMKRRAGDAQAGQPASGAAQGQMPGASVQQPAKAPSAAAGAQGRGAGGASGSRINAAVSAPAARMDSADAQALTRRERVESGKELRMQRQQLIQQLQGQ